MSSYGNEVSKWNLRHIRRIVEPLEPVASPSYANKFSAEKPISGIDRCLHIPGKADSAYSSFSGGSNIPECPISSYYNEGDSLPLQQLPYMDSGYIRGIYNSDFRHMYDNKTVEMSRHTKLDNDSCSGPYESTPIHEMLYQPPSPVARLLPPLPVPPSSRPQTDCYNINRNVEQTHSGIHSVHTEQCVQYSYKDLSFDSLANCYGDAWLSRCKSESPVAEEDDIWHAASQHITKKSNSPIVTEPCLMFQEFVTSGSLSKTQKILCAQNLVHTYKIPEEMNSKSSPSLHVSHNAVNDTQENKQCFYACSVHKPPFTEADLPSTVAVPGKPKGQLHRVLRLLEVDDQSGLEQDRCESCLSLKYTDSSPKKAVLGIINSYEDRNPCFTSEGETSRDVWQSLLKQQTRMQKPLPHGLDVAETPHCEVYDTANNVSYYKPHENATSQMLDGFREAKQNDNNHSPDLLTNPRQEEMLKPLHFPKQQFSKKALRQAQDDSASKKINRKTTPLLYYLSGGKNTDVMSRRNPAQEHEEVAIKSSSNNRPVSAEPIDIPRDSNNCVSDTANQNEGLILGSPASSVDEKFKNDYREKLKVAQRKVLRETSFKRKDLQMSLPIRLKQNPSSRPSIQHLRSLSLSSTNEDSKLIRPIKSLETINKEEDSKRPQTMRIGARKRATKEQKKFSYSEPEKLNQLDDQRDQSISWKKQNARSRSDEINGEDSRIIRNKALENQDRALSKAELKQIQHNALLEYMERKIGQRPAIAQRNTQQKSPLHSRSSSSTAAATSNHYASSPVSETANSKMQPSVSEGNWANKNAPTKSLLHSVTSVSSKSRERSKSTPSPMQHIYRSTACPAFSAQDHENYFTRISSPPKGDMEASPSDPKESLGVAKQSTYTAGRRGASVDESGTSEVVRLSPLSQSTDQLHHLKSCHIYSGLETGKNSQGAKHCNILQNCGSVSGHLFRQPDTEGVAEPKELNSTAQALNQPHCTNKLSSTLFSINNPLLCRVPPLSMGIFPSMPLEFLHSSSASSPETDNDVFKDSFTSGSEMASHLPSVYRQSKNSTPDRKTPEPALTASTLQASTERKQVKEEHNISIPFPETEEHNLGSKHGESGEENSAENSHCLKVAPELPVIFPEKRSNKDSQLKKEICETSQVSNASKRTQQQQIEASDSVHPLDNWACYFTTQRGNQGGNNNSDPLVNATIPQNEHDQRFPVQDTALSIAQSKSPEDQRCEDLATEIVAKDKSLVDILMPHPVRKTALDLMEGLFPISMSMLNQSCRKKGRIQKNDQRSSDGATDPSHETNIYLGQRAEDPMFHINHVLRKNRNSLDDPDNITSIKKELISSINLKLQALWDEREHIQSDVKEHAVHGKELESMVQDLCKPNEYERYMMFIGDLEKVVNLLLCLSSRLARIQNAMDKTDENTDAEERQSLHERHRLLSRQREDAKDLKENLDRRERVVSGILSKYITESQLQDFRHFVQTKISLLIEQKHLEEQIKFLEEQLERLEKSIPP